MQRSFFILAISMAAQFSSYAAADFLPVCDRTPAVKEALEVLVAKSCDQVVPADLLTLKRVDVQRKNIAEFKAGDFTGLTNLEILNIRSNPYTELPEGLLKDLVHLQTLVIIGTSLRNYPADYLADNKELKNIHVFRNQVKTISESVFERLENLATLEVLDVDTVLQPAELKRLQKMFPAGGKVELIIN